jgi:hypothetical protein
LRITSFIGLTTRTPVDTTLVAFCVSCYPLVLTFDLDPGNLPGCLAIQPFMLPEIAKGSKGIKLFIFASTLMRNAQSSSYSCRRFCIFWLTIVLACGISILDGSRCLNLLLFFNMLKGSLTLLSIWKPI